MKQLRLIGLAAASIVGLSGCLLTSPFWNQEFADHTKPVPMQAYTGTKNKNVRFQCAKAYHGGLYPSSGSATWTQVASVKPQQQPLFDSNGARVHGASKKKVLPPSCWRFDPSNSIWYAAVRATQGEKVLGTQQNRFHTFTKPGLQCLGKEVGKGRNWLGWLNKGCVSGAQYAIFRAVS